MAGLTFNEAAQIIRHAQNGIHEAEQVRDDPATSEAARNGAARRIRVFGHTIAATFSHFDEPVRRRLEDAVLERAEQTETLF
jgi:hypothetical protein